MMGWSNTVLALVAASGFVTGFSFGVLFAVVSLLPDALWMRKSGHGERADDR